MYAGWLGLISQEFGAGNTLDLSAVESHSRLCGRVDVEQPTEVVELLVVLGVQPAIMMGQRPKKHILMKTGEVSPLRIQLVQDTM
jgi:hypothetical protein